MHKLLAACYQFHHCPCNLLAEQIRELDVKEEQIGVWPYGIPDSISNQRKQKTSSNKTRLAYIGRWNRIKGIHILLKAMEKLQDHPELELTLYGEQETWNKDEYSNQITKTIQQLPNVTIGGRFNPAELSNLHQNIDAIITPSIWPENAPVSILEALALGTPVICADGEGMKDLIKEGQNGFLFESRNPDSLAKSIEQFINQKQNLQPTRIRSLEEDIQQFENIYQHSQPPTNHLTKEINRFIQTISSHLLLRPLSFEN